MVPETIIDKTIEQLEADQEMQINITYQIIETYPSLIGFLSQESNDILTEQEKDMLWYIVVVILKSSTTHGYQIDQFDSDLLSQCEEKNWEIIQNQKGSFRQKLDAFFVNYYEEDLLAFIEDTLEDDEESPLTTVGREVIFINSKSIIDAVVRSCQK